MRSDEIRQKFLGYFKERGHAVVASSSLIPDDPSVLLTTAGMQQFKKYYTGELDALADFGVKNTASVQKSFRTSDIDEVGDESHLTFFEMLGNFSFGGYFKKEAIQYAYDFITKEMGLPISYVTIFEGQENIGVPKDEESRAIWQSLDQNIKIVEQGMDDVFWGPTGSEGPCGPTTEIYCRNVAGQDIEIWNIVFNQFFFPGSREELASGTSSKKLEPLKTPGVDTGMGLERLAMCVQNKPNIFETDLFTPIIQKIEENTPRNDQRSTRIVADHIRAAVFMIGDGIVPFNADRGYILRRLLRRITHPDKSQIPVAEIAIELYSGFYHEFLEKKNDILDKIKNEEEKFRKTLNTGLKEFKKGVDSFMLHTSYGFPFDLTKDLLRKQGVSEQEIAEKEKEFQIKFKKHQEISRAGSEAKFGGHGLYLKTGEVTVRDESEVEKVTRLHTATHLLHAGLRAVLGPEVRQDGSDITVERTRFDFRFPRKVTQEELNKVEDWVNTAIQKDLKVEWKEMSFEEATREGALGFFREKYPPRVKVYTVYDEKIGEVYSKELCGGPHVEHTATIGAFKIKKEESSSAGVRRIRGIVEP